MSQPVLRLRFLFISSNWGWGGSEELWSAAAAELAAAGHSVAVCVEGIAEDEPRIRRLRELKCRIYDLKRPPFLVRTARNVARRFSATLRFKMEAASVAYRMRCNPSDLVVISQGLNVDGALVGAVCRRLKRPYVVIAQKASELYWPPDHTIPLLRALYEKALANYFVSSHNQRLTAEQLGVDLPLARVVRNPFLVAWSGRTDWPDQTDGLRLACVSRLYPTDKGQDLLLQVLARQKWRERALSVTFFGSGPQRDVLQRLAQRLSLTSVTFAGFVADVPAIWRDHHALVLPSRCEGLPLVLVEAMLSGRVAIVTDVGGTAEVVRDNESGFVASAATVDSLDDALERAWQRRHEWRAIGELAATSIRTLVPPDPAATFAKILLDVVPVTRHVRSSTAEAANATR